MDIDIYTTDKYIINTHIYTYTNTYIYTHTMEYYSAIK